MKDPPSASSKCMSQDYRHHMKNLPIHTVLTVEISVCRHQPSHLKDLYVEAANTAAKPDDLWFGWVTSIR